MCNKQHIKKTFYIVLQTFNSQQPKCIAIFKEADYVLALRTTTKKTVEASIIDSKNIPSIDTVKVEIPVEILY